MGQKLVDDFLELPIQIHDSPPDEFKCETKLEEARILAKEKQKG